MIIAGDHVNQIIESTVIVIIILVEDTMNTKKVHIVIMVAEALVEVQPAAVPQVVVPLVEIMMTMMNHTNIGVKTLDQIQIVVHQ